MGVSANLSPKFANTFCKSLQESFLFHVQLFSHVQKSIKYSLNSSNPFRILHEEKLWGCYAVPIWQRLDTTGFLLHASSDLLVDLINDGQACTRIRGQNCPMITGAAVLFFSQNHGMVWLKMDLKHHLVSTPAPQAQIPSTRPSRPHPTWSAILTGMGNLSRQPIPALHSPHSKEFLSNI